MTAVASSSRRAVGFDPLRSKEYQATRLGRSVADFLAWKALGGTAERTVLDYEWALKFLCLAYPQKALEEITDGDVAHVLRRFPVRSRRVRKAAYDGFFGWAVLTRRLERNPMVLLPPIKREKQRYIDVFSEAEVAALAELPDPDGILLRLLFDTGLRKSEARHIQVRHCSLDRGQVIVIGGKGDKDRLVPMVPALRAALAEFFLLEGLSPADYLWYNRPGGARLRRDAPIGETSFGRWWERCLRDAGVRYRKPHTTRHTFATEWRRRGLGIDEIQLLLGHASIQTTSDLYVHTDVHDVARHMALLIDA